MNLAKHLEFFNPISLDKAVHIIGIGAIGSRIAEQLVRLGVEQIHIYDFDIVDDYNITNQLYFRDHIGQPKEQALTSMLLSINPKVEIKAHGKYEAQALSGYIFLSVDSIELRHKITKANMYNTNILAMFDCRMRLTDAQSYAADWSEENQRKAFLSSMDFTDDEAKEATPISACGSTLSVCPTVITIASLTVSNFINFIRDKSMSNIILLDAFKFTLNSF